MSYSGDGLPPMCQGFACALIQYCGRYFTDRIDCPRPCQHQFIVLSHALVFINCLSLAFCFACQNSV